MALRSGSGDGSDDDKDTPRAVLNAYRLRSLRSLLIEKLASDILPALVNDPIAAGVEFFETVFLSTPFMILCRALGASFHILYDGRWLKPSSPCLLEDSHFDLASFGSEPMLYILCGVGPINSIQIYKSLDSFLARCSIKQRHLLRSKLRALRKHIQRSLWSKGIMTANTLEASQENDTILFGPLASPAGRVAFRHAIGYRENEEDNVRLSVSLCPLPRKRGTNPHTQPIAVPFYLSRYNACHPSGRLRICELKLGFREDVSSSSNSSRSEHKLPPATHFSLLLRKRVEIKAAESPSSHLNASRLLSLEPEPIKGPHGKCCANGRLLNAYLWQRKGKLSRRASTKLRLDAINYYLRNGHLKSEELLSPLTTCGFLHPDMTYTFGSERYSTPLDYERILRDRHEATRRKTEYYRTRLPLEQFVASMAEISPVSTSTWHTQLRSLKSYCNTYIIFVPRHAHLVHLAHFLITSVEAANASSYPKSSSRRRKPIRNRAYGGQDATFPTLVRLPSLAMTIVSLDHLFGQLPPPQAHDSVCADAQRLIDALAAEFDRARRGLARGQTADNAAPMPHDAASTIATILQCHWQETRDAYHFDFLAAPSVLTRNTLHYQAYLNECNRREPFEHSVCRLPAHDTFTLRQMQSGGFLTLPTRTLTRGATHFPCRHNNVSIESKSRAEVLLDLDVMSAYAAALSELHLPTGYIYHFYSSCGKEASREGKGTRGASNDPLVASCASNWHLFSEFKAHWAYLYLNWFPRWLRGEITSVALQSSCSLLPSLYFGKAILDLALSYIETATGLQHQVFINFHDSFIHFCPAGCMAQSHPWRDNDAAKEQAQKDAMWHAVARAHHKTMGTASTRYETHYVCHDFNGLADPFDSSMVYKNLNHLFSTCTHPFITIHRMYPNAKRPLRPEALLRRLKEADPSDPWLSTIFAVIEGEMTPEARARTTHNFSPLLAHRSIKRGSSRSVTSLVSCLTAPEATFKSGNELNMLLRCGAGFNVTRILHVFLCRTSTHHAALARERTEYRALLKSQNCPLLANHVKITLNSMVGLFQSKPKARQSMRFAFNISLAERHAFMKAGGDFSVLPCFGSSNDDQMVLIHKTQAQAPLEQPSSTGYLLTGMSIVAHQKYILASFLWGLELFLRPQAWCLLGGNTDSVTLSLASHDMRQLLRVPALLPNFTQHWQSFTTCPLVLTDESVRLAQPQIGTFNIRTFLSSSVRWTWVGYFSNCWTILVENVNARLERHNMVIDLRHSGMPSKGDAKNRVWENLIEAQRERRLHPTWQDAFLDRLACPACPRPQDDTFGLEGMAVFSFPVP